MAPSPTGEYHIGHIRTVLYNYALAKHNNGDFVVRIEDTDRNRYVEGATDRILDVIEAYGFGVDESPRHGGEYGPYTQSERLQTYLQYAEELIKKGFAYYCFLSPEETKEYQEIFRKQNKRFRSPYRDKSNVEIQKLIDSGKDYVIRLKVPNEGEVTFKDTVYGEVTYACTEIDDQILIKTDGYPTYHLAVVVDDHLMKISHVIRGNDWLPSTPKHVLMYEAFGWDLPIYIHLPNLKEQGGNKKLSKRFGAVFAIQFLEEGYLPEALVNFLMFLGWNPGDDREIFSLEEFVKEFDIHKIGKTDLVAFNRDKLLWFNKEYLKKTTVEDLKNYYLPWLEKYYDKKDLVNSIMLDTDLDKKLELIKERSKTLIDMTEMLDFFYTAPSKIDFDIKQLKRVRKVDGLVKKLQSSIVEVYESFDEDSSSWAHEEWETAMRKIGDENDTKHGDVFMVLRVSVVGGPVSPPLFESLQILGKEEVLKRLKKA